MRLLKKTRPREIRRELVCASPLVVVVTVPWADLRSNAMQYFI